MPETEIDGRQFYGQLVDLANAALGPVKVHIREDCDELDAVVILPTEATVIFTNRKFLGEYAEPGHAIPPPDSPMPEQVEEI